ncbi:MAG: LysR substrate-binding domain-containing protein [Pigmentiphaga sp.]|uniref:LysR substrate-binding domain-containing protein n=1 Tax=Pigmentiphaga sp. TaxID=1977564 RepID=UPI003B5565D7
MHALRAFEAAARLLSISRAAAELHVTPAAVSRQVQGLERFLGVALLVRGHRRIALSRPGLHYFSEVTQLFARLRDVTQNVSAVQPAFSVHVAVPPTFAARWLIPRLAPFHSSEPGTSVQLVAPAEAAGRDDIDVDIRFGDGHWPGCQAFPLVRNIVAPVCNAQFPVAHARGAGLEALRGCTLLYSLTRPGDWFAWIKHAGVEAPAALPVRRLGYESSMLAYQAAICGLGIAMAQVALVAGELASGTLVSPFETRLDMGALTYYLVVPRNRKRRAEVRRFTEWLAGTGRSESGTPTA